MLNATDRGIGFAVWRGDENITKDQLNEPVGDDVIRIAPIIMGSKNAGFLNIVLGVILIAVSFMDGGLTAPEAAGVLSAGIGLAAGGVVALLTPVPKGTKNKSVANEPSYAFNGAVNTQA
ncbi:tail assembly protein [Rhodanobacter sp. 115]|uniref:tail assembly protein n=1 Tax=Rhodanobacter sp. FW021-MT20 TaxID=1162282 RepID=UPI000260D24D|nr:tail assembly protein [Rhodanobacter sp. 115]EIL98223.1 phage tail assembly protein I [Rhodanobacter sp. 115]